MKNLYINKDILIICLLGFVSGLPLLLTASTLSIWLAEENINKAVIGAFSLVGLPYSLKFLWAPLFDHARIPFLTKLLGRRRSFLLVIQLLLILSLVALGFSNPQLEPTSVALWALCVAFFSASQDIIIDAYRVEILDQEHYGTGAASVVLGYRVGMLVASAGALYLTVIMPWKMVYLSMALLLFIGVFVCLCSREPNFSKNLTININNKNFIRTVILAPLKEFVQRKNWLALLCLIMLYKLGDAFLTSMSNVFFINTGFSNAEIASVTKIFGLIATLGGGFIAGAMSARLGILQTMLLCGVIHVVANFIFVVQAIVGYNLSLLVVTIAIENITAGMTAVSLVAFISSLCGGANTATSYALLSSIMAIGRTVLTSSSGLIANFLGWPLYFVFTSFIALPALLLIVWLMRKPNWLHVDQSQT